MPSQLKVQYDIGSCPTMKLTRRSVFATTAGVLASSSNALAAFSSASEKRREEAYKLRLQAARAERDQPLPDHVSNGDESAYATHIGNFTKGLPHNDLGEVDSNAYTTLLNALKGPDPAEMEKILMG